MFSAADFIEIFKVAVGSVTSFFLLDFHAKSLFIDCFIENYIFLYQVRKKDKNLNSVK